MKKKRAAARQAYQRTYHHPRKAALRKLLNTPIKENIYPLENREAKIREETDRRWAAAFELYDISTEVPDEAKYIALAVYLLGENFKGCRTLARQPGGAPAAPDKITDNLRGEWKEFLKTARVGSDLDRARWFIEKKDGAVDIGRKMKITKPKSLLNRLRHLASTKRN